MLARLDQGLAPLRSSVNQEGNLLRIHGPADEPDLAQRVVAIVEQMGSVAEPIETPANVARWFGAEDVDELSQEEAHALAERWARDLEGEGVVESAGRVIEPLRVTLLDAFREAARRGSLDDMRIEETPIRAALDEAEARRVLRWIEQKLVPPNAADHGPK